MQVILSHTMKVLYVTVYVKLQTPMSLTWQLRDYKIGSKPQIWQICD